MTPTAAKAVVGVFAFSRRLVPLMFASFAVGTRIASVRYINEFTGRSRPGRFVRKLNQDGRFDMFIGGGALLLIIIVLLLILIF